MSKKRTIFIPLRIFQSNQYSEFENNFLPERFQTASFDFNSLTHRLNHWLSRDSQQVGETRFECYTILLQHSFYKHGIATAYAAEVLVDESDLWSETSSEQDRDPRCLNAGTKRFLVLNKNTRIDPSNIVAIHKTNSFISGPTQAKNFHRFMSLYEGRPSLGNKQLDEIIAKSYELAMRVNKASFWNGTKKARYTFDALYAIYEAVGDKSVDAAQVENLIRNTRTDNGKTLPEALGWHRLFSFKQSNRGKAHSLIQFETILKASPASVQG